MGRLRIEEFYNRIDVSTTDEELMNICNLEKEYITNNYNTLESRKATFTLYRTAFANYYLKNKFDNYKDIYKDIIVISKNKITDIKILLQTSTKHCLSIIELKNLVKKNDGVRILSLKTEEMKVINEKYKDKVASEQKHLKLIKNPQGLIDKAISLLSSKSYIDKVLGLAALTGRRVAEIGCTAEFIPFNKNIVIFKGQLKTKDRVHSDYEIPLLYSTDSIIICLNKIRSDMPQYVNNVTKFHSNYSKELSLKVKKHFNEFVEGDITAKDLRAIYVTIVCKKYKPERMAQPYYYSKILGHVENDLNTGNSYLDFKL